MAAPTGGVTGAVAPGSIQDFIGKDSASRFTLWTQVVTQANTPQLNAAAIARFAGLNLASTISQSWQNVGGIAADQASGTYLIPTDEVLFFLYISVPCARAFHYSSVCSVLQGVLSTLAAMNLDFGQVVLSTVACDRLLKYHTLPLAGPAPPLSYKDFKNNAALDSALFNNPSSSVNNFYVSWPLDFLTPPPAGLGPITVNGIDYPSQLTDRANQADPNSASGAYQIDVIR